MKLVRLIKVALFLPLLPALNCGGIFGGPSPSTPPPPPPPPAPEPIPDLNEKEPEAKAVREDEARKLRQRSGASGTVLTSPLGLAAETGGGLGKTLLGRSGV